LDAIACHRLHGLLRTFDRHRCRRARAGGKDGRFSKVGMDVVAGKVPDTRGVKDR
jgi:hypothetical protein